MTPLRSMTPSEVTLELLRLCGEAGAVERRMLLVFMCGDDRGVATPTTALSLLEETIAAMPDEERAIQLFIARRVVAVGQRGYGRFDLNAESRTFALEAILEDVDACVYRAAAEMQGRPDGLLPRSLGIMRDALGKALRRELL